MKAIGLISLVCFMWVVDVEAQVVKEKFKAQAGRHYDVINPAWQGGEDQQVVYEFFSYMCPGCYAFEPHMGVMKSQLSETQKIVRVPVSLYAQWEPHAKTYYALMMMGTWEKVHQPFFDALHQYKKPLRTLEDIAAWLSASFAVDEKKFLATANSFAVDSQIRQAQKMIQAMGVSRVPTLVVNGRFKPNFQTLQTPERIIQTTVELLNQ